MPFLSPTQDHVFTQRELRNVLPEYNQGFRAVPQLLTKNADDFLWCAGELAAMGYDEVNLNLGCPSGTVVAKGKGSGLLGAPEALDRMLDRIFSGSPVAVSLKTRLGLEDPEEFARLLEIFGRYPVSLLIVHPRVRKDFYRHPVRVEYFEQAVDAYHGPLCFNGGLVTAEDCARFARRFPQVDRVMIGQGLLADPALVQKAKGGPGAGREALRAFHDELYHTYLEIFASQRNTVFHMKELWSYLGPPVPGGGEAAEADPQGGGLPCIRGGGRSDFCSASAAGRLLGGTIGGTNGGWPFPGCPPFNFFIIFLKCGRGGVGKHPATG